MSDRVPSYGASPFRGRTLGDELDRSMGGPKHYFSHHCVGGRHRVCMEVYGGRSCECECHDQRYADKAGT